MDWKTLPITTILIVYLFICGALYSIGFWSTFNLDVSNLMTFSEIPKCFVLPFASTFGFLIFQNIIVNHVFDDRKSIEGASQKAPIGFWQKLYKLIIQPRTILLLLFLIAFLLYPSSKEEYIYWFTISELFAITSWLIFVRDGLIQSKFNNRHVRSIFGYVIIMFPILSFGSGKMNSTKVLSNTDIKFTIYEHGAAKDTLKLVSYIGDKVILCTLDNKKVFVVNQNMTDTLVLENYDNVRNNKP